MDLNTISAVETVLHKLSVRIDLIQNHIRIGLVTCSESNDLEMFGHPFEETDGVGSDGDVGLGS